MSGEGREGVWERAGAGGGREERHAARQPPCPSSRTSACVAGKALTLLGPAPLVGKPIGRPQEKVDRSTAKELPKTLSYLSTWRVVEAPRRRFGRAICHHARVPLVCPCLFAADVHWLRLRAQISCAAEAHTSWADQDKSCPPSDPRPGGEGETVLGTSQSSPSIALHPGQATFLLILTGTTGPATRALPLVFRTPGLEESTAFTTRAP